LSDQGPEYCLREFWRSGKIWIDHCLQLLWSICRELLAKVGLRSSLQAFFAHLYELVQQQRSRWFVHTERVMVLQAFLHQNLCLECWEFVEHCAKHDLRIVVHFPGSDLLVLLPFWIRSESMSAIVPQCLAELTLDAIRIEVLEVCNIRFQLSCPCTLVDHGYRSATLTCTHLENVSYRRKSEERSKHHRFRQSGNTSDGIEQ
jgi:hypothetical protein